MRQDVRVSVELAIAIALAGALLALVVSRWLRGARGSWRAKRRAGRALAGEEAAAELLTGVGFAIVGRQVRISWAPIVDGVPVETELRADYLVEAEGERLVAEVKTGEAAPRFDTAATRRQLLEYHVAFAVDAVLLVCPERGAIHRVEFARARTAHLIGAPASTTRSASSRG